MLVDKSIKACLLDMSPNKVLVAPIDKWKPGTALGRTIHVFAKASIVRFETSLNRDGTDVRRTYGLGVATVPIDCQRERSS